jgi:GAF domain-containing protein
MSREIITLKGVQLAYARAIAAIELRFYRGAHGRTDESGDGDSAHDDAERIVRQLERDGDLRPHGWDWRQRVPLIDLYEFSESERALLLDLADAGGIQITRNHDSRFNGLGCGNGGKKAVMESVQNRWKVQLTDRGEALVEALKAEVNQTTA